MQLNHVKYSVILHRTTLDYSLPSSTISMYVSKVVSSRTYSLLVILIFNLFSKTVKDKVPNFGRKKIKNFFFHMKNGNESLHRSINKKECIYRHNK